MLKQANPKLDLLDLTQTPERFFTILPADWRSEIEPYWPEYAVAATIYGLATQEEVVAGGIVSSIVTRDIAAYKEVAQEWMDKGYRYIGFLFVQETRRGEGLGTLLIQEIKAQAPTQKFWLSIDDHRLLPFYQRLGFQLAQKVQNGMAEEWILVD